MARGRHRFPKVSVGPAMPNPFMPCGRATPEMTLQLFQGRPTRRVGSRRPSSTPLDTPHRTSMNRRKSLSAEPFFIGVQRGSEG
jgi:hypothetical protein